MASSSRQLSPSLYSVRSPSVVRSSSNPLKRWNNNCKQQTRNRHRSQLLLDKSTMSRACPRCNHRKKLRRHKVRPRICPTTLRSCRCIRRRNGSSKARGRADRRVRDGSGWVAYSSKILPIVVGAFSLALQEQYDWPSKPSKVLW